MEIERKFLVTAAPAGLAQTPGKDIRQGYLAVDGGVEVRVREKAGTHVLTVKGGHGLVRTEVDLPLDAAHFAELWALTEGRRVEKRRHELPLDGGLVLELDVYAGALDGLLTAEVEFGDETASAAFVPPDWLGPELTGDKRYANQALATHGRP